MPSKQKRGNAANVVTKSIRPTIRALEAKAEVPEKADKPDIKQLKAVPIKFNLSPADVKLAMNGHTRKGFERRSQAGAAKVS